MAKDKDQQARVELIIDGKMATASMRDLEAAARKVKGEMSGMLPGTPEFERAAQNLGRINAQLTDVRVQAGLTKSSFEKLMDTAKGVFVGTLGANLAEAGVTKLFTAFQNGIQTFKEFESSLKILKSLTGIDGAGMDYLRDSALKTSNQLGVSAKEVVEAYKLMAGAKPELLTNKEALADITKEAIKLSKASGLDLPEASKRLVDALNQFNAPASEAGRYVNILAEGARLSAAEVPDITNALLEFGTAAKSANVSIGASTAAIETLAEKGLKGSEAGTKLRNVLLVLNAPEVLDKKALSYFEEYGVSIDTLKDKSLPLADRLKELGKIQGDAGAIASVFGKENSIAGEILITNADRVKQLTEALNKDGLNTAQEQATENTKTLANQITRMGNAWDNIMAKQGAIGSFLGFMAQKLTNVLIAADNAGSELEIFFSNVQPLSEKAAQYLIDFGKTNTGKPLQEFLSKFDKISNKDFMVGAEQNKQKFVAMMVAEGESVKNATAIFDKYIKNRTDAMIAASKTVNTIAQPTDNGNNSGGKNDDKLEKKAADDKKKREKEEADDQIKRRDQQIQVKDERMKMEEEDAKALQKLLHDLANNKFLDAVDSKDNEINEVKKYYAERLALARQFGLDEKLVTDQEAAALALVHKKWDAKALGEKKKVQQAELQASRQLFNELTGLANLMGATGIAATGLGKTIALANIAFDTAQAIAALTKNSELNPANAVTMGAAGGLQFAAGIVRIMTNIGSAYQVLSGAPSFFDGGYTGNGGNLDSRGGFSAILHPNEYVVNAKAMQNPVVNQMVQSIESGNVSKMNNTSDNAELVRVLSMLSNNLVNDTQIDNELYALLQQLKEGGLAANLFLDDERLFKLSKALRKYSLNPNDQIANLVDKIF